MYEVQNKDTIKSEIPPSFVCGKTWLALKKQPGCSHSTHALQVENQLSKSRLLLRFHDAVPVGHGSIPYNRSRWR